MTSTARPICLGCKHFTESASKLVCDAFPEGIPQAIYLSRVDHRKPVSGDGGIVFEAKSDKAMAYATALFSTGPHERSEMREFRHTCGHLLGRVSGPAELFCRHCKVTVAVA